MTGTIKTTTVAGKTYKVWSDFIQRATYAENEDGEIKKICGGSYLRNDLTIRKAISYAFQTGTFKK